MSVSFDVSKMGLKEFKIQFDKPRANYAPGDSVTGKVCLITDSAEALRGE